MLSPEAFTPHQNLRRWGRARGIERDQPRPAGNGGDIPSSAAAPPESVRATSQHSLELRRSALLDEMRDSLESARTRRATLAAALENLPIQLLRIGAGIGSADDMREDVALLAALADGDASASARRPLSPRG